MIQSKGSKLDEIHTFCAQTYPPTKVGNWSGLCKSSTEFNKIRLLNQRIPGTAWYKLLKIYLKNFVYQWSSTFLCGCIYKSIKLSNMSSIAEKVTKIIVEKLGITDSEVTPEASFTTDLGADSLDTVELIMEFEKQFDISIPDAEAENIKTVGDAITYLEANAK